MQCSLLALALVLEAVGFAWQDPAVPPRAASASSAPEIGAARGTVVTEVSRECWFVHQAKSGDYWFGSNGQGVFRYDGARIVNYTTTDGLSGNDVRGIQEDDSGRLYFTTGGGICRFDGRGFNTLPVVEAPEDGGWRLHSDDLWFPWFKGMPGVPGTEGPYRYDGTTLYHLKLPRSDREAAFRASFPNAGFSPYDVYSIYRDSRGHIWIGTCNFGVCRFDGQSFGWLYEDHLVYAPNGGLFALRSVIEDQSGAFWICNTKFRFRVQPMNEDGRVAYTREPGIDAKASNGSEVYFQGAVADADGDLWLSPYGGGIWRYDGEGMTNYPVEDDGKDTHVFRIFKDNAGGLWLGTQTAGPYRFDGEGFAKFQP
jgi:ligand-binding sensor domain-containing protein